MRDEYDIKNLKPRRNPYTNRLKKQITINIDNRTVDYFKEESEASGYGVEKWHLCMGLTLELK